MYIIPENNPVVHCRYLHVSSVNAHTAFAKSSMAFCSGYYQTSIPGLKNDQVLIPQLAISTFSHCPCYCLCLSKNSNHNLCHLSLSGSVLLFLQHTEFVQSPVRISSCLTNQGARHDENGKSLALRNPTEQMRSSARLTPDSTPTCASAQSSSRPRVQCLLRTVPI